MPITYSDKPWFKFYDPGVPTTLQPYPNHPLQQFLRDAAMKTPNAVATVTSAHLPLFGRKKAIMTYKELDSYSDALAAALVDMGVKKGDRVAIVLPNCAQFPIAFFAILKAGGVVSAINPTFPASKMRDQIQESGATTVITLSLFYNQIKAIQPETPLQNVIVTNIKEYLPPLASFLFTIARERKEGHRIEKRPVDDTLARLLTKYAGQKPNVTVKPDDIALFQFTGGTTGVPKAAVSNHQALVCNSLQIRSFLANDIDPRGEVFLAAIPLFHVFGMVAVMSFAVLMGGSMLLVPNPREIKDVLEVIHAYRPTIFMGVPAMYNSINNHRDVISGKYNVRSIKVCVSGSAPLAPATKRRFEELTGGKLVEGFGMSECPTAVCANPVHGDIREGSIGIPLPDVEMRIVSLDDELTDVPVGKSGELVIWAPNLMLYYHEMPEETYNALRLGPDGRKWLYTGDIAYMDEDGYFYIIDRKKDMIIRGGFNVYPANVEKVLLEHPAIQDVGVAAIPHPDPAKVGQETLKAWIVLKPGYMVTEQELIKFALKKLAGYEVPAHIEFVSELPKTLVGKVLRRELVKMEMDRRAKAQAQSKSE